MPRYSRSLHISRTCYLTNVVGTCSHPLNISRQLANSAGSCRVVYNVAGALCPVCRPNRLCGNSHLSSALRTSLGTYLRKARQLHFHALFPALYRTAEPPLPSLSLCRPPRLQLLSSHSWREPEFCDLFNRRLFHSEHLASAHSSEGTTIFTTNSHRLLRIHHPARDDDHHTTRMVPRLPTSPI